MELRSLTGLKVTLGLVLRGGLAGVAATALLTLLDLTLGGGRQFGLRTGVIGVLAGGMLLVLALGISCVSYWMASRGRMASLRRRLLAGAVWAGAAGGSLGTTAALVWLAAGHPI